MLALLRAGRPAPGRAPPRAIDCFLRLNLFKAPEAIQSVCGSRRALRRRQHDRLLLRPVRSTFRGVHRITQSVCVGLVNRAT